MHLLKEIERVTKKKKIEAKVIISLAPVHSPLIVLRGICLLVISDVYFQCLLNIVVCVKWGKRRI